MKADERGEATVGPGDDTLLADDIDELPEPFRDQFGVLDAVSLGVDYPNDKRLVVRQLNVLPNGPFMLMARICRLHVDELCSRLKDQVDDVLKGDILVMWAEAEKGKSRRVTAQANAPRYAKDVTAPRP